MSPSSRKDQMQKAAELDEQTLYGDRADPPTTKPDRYQAPQCPRMVVSWPNGRQRCMYRAGHRGECR